MAEKECKEYIDRKTLLNEIEEIRPMNWTDTEAEITEQADFDWFENLVKSQPIADVQEVRHGKWIYVDGVLDWADYKCSKCEYIQKFGDDTCFYNYCPECGAKMDKE